MDRESAGIEITSSVQNPATDVAYLTLGNPREEKLQVIISDLNGREMLKTKIFTFHQVKGRQELTVSSLRPGIYLLRLMDAKTGIFVGEVKKLVINK
jgi:hypothetical protein